MNRVELLGRIASDLEIKFLPASGKPVTRFSLAVTDPYRKAKGEENNADFFNVTVFGARAENIVNYMSKGRNLVVCGRLKNRKYVDKSGVTRYSTDVIANDVFFIDWGKGNNDSTNHAQHNEPPENFHYNQEMIPVDDDEMPF